MKLKNLLGTLALLPVLAGLTACAAETGEEELGFEDGVALDDGEENWEEIPIDSVEQGFTEATCVSATAHTTPTWSGCTGLQFAFTESADASYTRTGCTNAFITTVPGAVSAVTASWNEEPSAPTPAATCAFQRLRTRVFVYTASGVSELPMTETSGTWVPSSNPLVSGTCNGPFHQISVPATIGGNFVTGVKVATQAYMGGTSTTFKKVKVSFRRGSYCVGL